MNLDDMSDLPDDDEPGGFEANLRRESALTLAVQYASSVKNQNFSTSGICRVAEIFLAWMEGVHGID